MNQRQWRDKLRKSRDTLSAEVLSLQRQLDEIKLRQELARTERDKLSKLLVELDNGKIRSGFSDKWHVKTEELSPMIVEWLDQYDATHDGGAITTLSMMTEISTQTINRIKYVKTNTVTFTVADKLLTAINRIQELSELTLIPVKTGPKINKPPESVYYEE